jgi:hypothetical protein
MQSIQIDEVDDFNIPEPIELYTNHGCLISGSILILYLVTVLYYVFNKGV